MKKITLPLLALGLMVLAGILTAAPAPPVRATVGDWPQWRGPDRNDISRETGLLKSWPLGGPKLLWTFNDAGTGFAGMAVAGDRLYSMGADTQNDLLFAVDLKTQRKLWSIIVGPRTDNGWGDGPRGTPTVDGDLVYALGGEGNLICVKADTGAKVWLKGLKTDLGGGRPNWGYTESPLVDGDQVVVTPGGRKGTIAALNKKTGEVLWRSTDYTDNANYASLILGEGGGIRQYIQMTGESVAGVAAKDGRLLWRYPRRGPTAAIPTPIFSDGYVYATSGYNAGCDLIKLVPRDGGVSYEEVYKNKNMTNQHGGVVLVGDYLYGYSENGGWTCQEFKTGKVVWKENRKLDKGSLTCADGHLYCYSMRDGTCALIAASSKGWEESGRLKIPQQTQLPRKRGQIWTHPVVAEGKLFLRDQDLIFCYDVKEAR